ncbi:sialidase family protein [Brachyspira pilosicoli]|uniref:sialidase family protein n=1 Tax=Brachyspira pilosicoli TaxID=52584 RepID=UPI0030045B1A
MSKKIIYLLSLLMALSLVFASCKKNAAGTGPDLGGLTPPPDTGAGEDLTGDNGLFGKYEDIPNDTEIANTGVYVTTDGNYYRNPVLVAREDGTLFVFAEKRWRSKGSGNDVGIDGINTTDVIYKVSQNGGYKFDTQEYTVGAQATGPENSHGAPVVFVKDTTIVVLATSGAGIGRTSQETSQKTLQSKIEYISGTINGSSIQWTGTWKEISLSSGGTLMDKIKSISAGGSGNKNFDQFGTPPSRGVVDNSGNMYLAIVLAYQGTLNNPYELMGRMTLKASINNPATWEVVEEPVNYTGNTQVQLGPWKETKLISVDGTGSTFNHLIVPSPWTPDAYKPKVLGTGKKDDSGNITKTAVAASEGSPGFLATTKWYGDTPYTLSKDSSTGKVTINGGSATSANIVVHVQQTASQLYLYRVNDQFQIQGQGLKLDDVGKSSSVDMLPDGTIVVAAEKGGENQNYFIRLLRYSQPYLMSKTK